MPPAKPVSTMSIHDHFHHSLIDHSKSYPDEINDPADYLVRDKHHMSVLSEPAGTLLVKGKPRNDVDYYAK